LSRDYQILVGNKHYRHQFGDEPVERHQFCYQVSHHYTVPCDQAGESCPLNATLESGQPARVLHLHHTPRGDEHVDVEAYPIFGDDGEARYFLEVIRSSRLASPDPRASGLVGRSPSFNRVLELVQRVAPSEATVLLLGESGTGKELVAAAVHEASGRAKGPFVPVDCSGLTETLFESELFGHEKGAFTGAQSRKIGLVEAASGGTLFLDEIGDVPLPLQVKLLRLLETGTYRRVGGIEAHKADFRLVCATHRSVKKMVQEGSFRNDLFYRINAFPIELPSLRERKEDIPLLVENLLRRCSPGRKLHLNAEAMECLHAYDFPGNIRELRNILERASLLADGDEIRLEHLPGECCERRTATREGAGGLPTQSAEIVTLDEAERRYLNWVLARYHGERKDLAAELGVSERTLYRKIEALKKE
jgi:DNA-binding NtrC family response regulator